MKKYFIASLASVAAISILASCVKETPANESEKPAGGELITITATIPDGGLTKVDMAEESYGGSINLVWHEGDKIIVTDAADATNKQEFTLSDGAGTASGTFTGLSLAEATSYNISYDAIGDNFSYAVQTQAADASTAHLKYAATISGVSDYTAFEFSDAWATKYGGTFASSSVLRVRAKLGALNPKDVNAVILKSDAAIFAGNKELKVIIGTPGTDEGELGFITVYATLPAADQAIEAGTELIAQFQMSDKAYDKYTVYRKLGAGTISAGKVNTFNIDCGNNFEKFAGKDDDGTEEHPFLIGDQHQMDSIRTVLKHGVTTYFKMVDDVDMTGVDWVQLNYSEADSYDYGIDFDGDNHTISNLSASYVTEKYVSFIGVLYGTIKDVTFDKATVTGGSQKCGVVAGYVGTGTKIGYCSGVSVTNSTISGSDFIGAFAGQVAAAGTIDDCHVSNCTVNQNCTDSGGQKSTGGFIGFCKAAATITNCTVQATINSLTPGKSGVGGFIGKTETTPATFTDNAVLSGTTITAAGNWIGGFAGYTQIGGVFTNCTTAASVSVSSTGQFAGGFVGYSGNATYTNCGATGTVVAPVNVGGFVGSTDAGSFINSYYGGSSVEATNTSGNNMVGGFCGVIGNTGPSFDGCYVYSASGVTVTGHSQRVGGFFGQNSKNGTTNQCTTTKCYVKNVTVNGGKNTGGFVGVQYSNISKSWVEDCTVNGGEDNNGGFSGFISGCNLEDSYSKSTTVAGGTHNVIGGLVGITNKGININRCYSNASVTGTGTSIGGLIGSLVSGATADKCISWNSTLPLAGAEGGTSTNNYVKSETETGTVSSHAQETDRSWSSTVWDFSTDLPTLK